MTLLIFGNNSYIFTKKIKSYLNKFSAEISCFFWVDTKIVQSCNELLFGVVRCPNFVLVPPKAEEIQVHLNEMEVHNV